MDGRWGVTKRMLLGNTGQGEGSKRGLVAGRGLRVRVMLGRVVMALVAGGLGYKQGSWLIFFLFFLFHLFQYNYIFLIKTRTGQIQIVTHYIFNFFWEKTSCSR